MARKVNQKAKEKKAERKAMEAKMNLGWANVRAANALEDPLSALPSFRTFSRNGLNLTLETKRVTHLDHNTKEWIFKLLETNMKLMYLDSDWGWNETNKRVELTEDLAWYLIARTEEGTPVAYSHFRYDLDFDDEVLYCYEIQLESKVRKKGLGKFMMKVLELLTIKANMLKIMATVFKHNPSAVDFFKKGLNFSPDETNPVDSVYEQFDYEILSKINQRKKKSMEEEGKM